MRKMTITLLILVSAGILLTAQLANPELDIVYVEGMIVPEFPAVFRLAEISGAVDIEAQVSPDGSVATTKCLTPKIQLCFVTVNAVKGWKFRVTHSAVVRVSVEYRIVPRGRDATTEWRRKSPTDFEITEVRPDFGPVPDDDGNK